VYQEGHSRFNAQRLKVRAEGMDGDGMLPGALYNFSFSHVKSTS
jgi:hypothetical protein